MQQIVSLLGFAISLSNKTSTETPQECLQFNFSNCRHATLRNGVGRNEWGVSVGV